MACSPPTPMHRELINKNIILKTLRLSNALGLVTQVTKGANGDVLISSLILDEILSKSELKEYSLAQEWPSRQIN